MIIEATLIVFVAGFAASALLTEFVRRRAVRLGRHDLPNERSSHTIPTPRGGGIGIAIVVLVAAFALLGSGPLAVATLVGGLLYAVVGYLDDRLSLRARTRLLAQTAAGAALAAAWGLAPLTLGPGLVLPALLAPLFVVLFAVWMTNLYNFMDGIDGIAGSQALTAGVTLSALAFANHQHFIGLFALAIGAAAAGFLTRNWPPARIFMGDVGSAFLGFVFAALALVGLRDGAFALPAVAIALAPFVVDATFTLLRRATRGRRLWLAHRSHAYQRLARKLGRHRPVTVGILAAGGAVLAPLAWLSEQHASLALPIAASTWLVLGTLAWAAGAGLDDDEPDPFTRRQRA